MTMAASGTAVTVLTPNGRRQTVKVSPNTPLLQVLEDVCKKHGFSSEDHGLKFQRTVLDLTLQWRFANLPNNAKLEMVPSTKKPVAADSQVRIALQMEDGSRLQGSFSCGQSLWELLTHFPQISVLELSESGAIPVCVYMRDEVAGEEALKNATLKSLGLTGGSAIVRFLIKKNKTHGEQNGEEATEPAVPTTPVAEYNPPSPSPQPEPAPSQPKTVTTEVPTASADKPTETLLTPNTAAAPSLTPEQKDKALNSQDAVRPKEPLIQTWEAPSCSSSSSAPSAPSAPFIPFSGGGQRLGGPGGAAPTRTSLAGHSSVVESPKAKKPKSCHSSTNKSPTVCHHFEEDMDQGEEFLEPIERESLVYHMDCQSHETNNVDLPDEFFEVTVDDVRKRFAQLKSERKLLEEAPLTTKALREAQMKEKMQRYPKVVLRIQFPDRHVLQGFFRPLETVGALRQFVRSHLEDPQLSFYLFITPPKTILKDPSVTLFQADLFPGALVYFGSDIRTDIYLKKELLDSSVSPLQANESIASCMLPSQTPSSSSLDPEEPHSSPEQNIDTSGLSHEDPATQSQAAKPRSDPAKVPKWLKLPGKN